MLELRKVKKIYSAGETAVHALAGIDLHIAENEFASIMGASGSGKSTLMNILGCLDTPSDGAYFFEDMEISSLDDDQLAVIRNKHLGFVFQGFNLLPRMSALKNVTLPLLYSRESHENYHEWEERAATVLEQVGLAHRATHKPTELSGGEMQRVAIARALVNRPAVILADEPTGNLDTATSKEIMALFQRLHEEGQTIIMVTHEPDIADYTQRVITLRDGKIIDDYKRN